MVSMWRCWESGVCCQQTGGEAGKLAILIGKEVDNVGKQKDHITKQVVVLGVVSGAWRQLEDAW